MVHGGDVGDGIVTAMAITLPITRHMVISKEERFTVNTRMSSRFIRRMAVVDLRGVLRSTTTEGHCIHITLIPWVLLVECRLTKPGSNKGDLTMLSMDSRVGTLLPLSLNRLPMEELLHRSSLLLLPSLHNRSGREQ
jgi:hypothetical protein